MKMKISYVIVCASVSLVVLALLLSNSVKNGEQIGLKEIQASTAKTIFSANDTPYEITNPKIMEQVFSLLFDADYSHSFANDKVDGGAIIYWQDENGNDLMTLHQNRLKIGDRAYKTERNLVNNIRDIISIYPDDNISDQSENTYRNWAGWTIDQYLDCCSGVYKAECLSVGKKEGMQEYSIAFRIDDVLYGTYDETATEFRTLSGEPYTPGKEYVIICGKESSAYSSDNYYGISAVLYERDEGLSHEGIYDFRPTTLTEAIAYIQEYSSTHTTAMADKPSSSSGENTDLMDIYEDSETVMVIEAIEAIDNSVADRTSYSYKVIDLIKGEDCDGHWLVAYKESMTPGGRYLVMVDKPDENSVFFIMSSRNSLFELDSAEAQKILMQAKQ